MLVMGELLAWAANVLPRRTAVTLHDDVLTFAECDARANRAAHTLASLGVERHDHVAVWSDVSLRVIDVRFGLARLGAAFAPLNPAYTESEAATALAYLRPRLLIVDGAHCELGAALAKDLDLPVASIEAPPGAAVGLDLNDAMDHASTRVSAFTPELVENDTDCIFLTSGSTGRPKGVMLSHRAQWLRAFAGSTLTITSGGRGEMCLMPLFHMAGWNFLQEAWSAGRAIHLMPRPSPEDVLREVERQRAGRLYCIPAVWRRILDVGPRDKADASSLQWAMTGTSMVSTDLIAAIKERLPDTRITLNYGSTEAGQAVALADEDLARKPGAVGLPVPGTRALQGDDGELLLHNDALMTGYLDLPDETAAALDGGWYHTGDLVSIDEEGYISIVGRTKEIIRSGGESIAPIEVESVVRSHPAVRDVAIVGVPDERWGELVCAAIVVEPGRGAPSVEELRKFIGARLAPYKHPRRIITVDDLPRTAATGQTQRSLLRQLGL